ncbi:right-handed parallel beta-helix repeat-containing protein [Mucilaginibacter xinganensis]|uniref:Right handed beta helix domain-containing protein n=1 Tax=Mucilaginibacter xinganensis TaxID=1234841 RepID=A0A223NV81_9SPHI|nr:right-handed parallel beta-helix repeat-containing protein [Mucilaginibacter xinganensis]ASU33528.1 hypothetical protein MuYL_1630 [Mucilaginibacter xinganensis]
MNLKKYAIASCAVLALYISSARKNFAQHKAAGRAYYINNAGSDNNPGTLTHPFQSIGKINGLHLAAGDIIYFKAGQIFKGTLLLTQNISGTKQQPVIITSIGKGRAIINAGDSSAISVYKTTNVKLQRLVLTGHGRKGGNIKHGLAIIASSNIRVDDLDISGFQKSGLLIYSSQNIITNKVFAHNNGAAGITVEGPYQKRESNNINILNCRAENNAGDPTNLTNHSGNGIVVGNCKNVLIDHCTATNNGWDMPRKGNGPVGIWAYEADSITIQHCLSYKNKTSEGGADGGGFDLDGGVTNSIVQYCLSYQNQGSGYCLFQYWGASPWHHNIFRYNISEDDGAVSDSQAGLYVWNSSGDEKQFYDCSVYGNIIYNTKVAAICFSDVSKSRGLRFYNNIFVGRDSLIKGWDKIGDVLYYYNNWWSIAKGFNIDGINSLSAWSVKTGKEQQDGKLTGLNIRPDFKKPGRATVTSASQLKSFINYQLPANSILRTTPVYTGSVGIKNISL